jgi:hypothetical protein
MSIPTGELQSKAHLGMRAFRQTYPCIFLATAAKAAAIRKDPVKSRVAIPAADPPGHLYMASDISLSWGRPCACAFHRFHDPIAFPFSRRMANQRN